MLFLRVVVVAGLLVFVTLWAAYLLVVSHPIACQPQLANCLIERGW
jgi:hypothetical protein